MFDGVADGLFNNLNVHLPTSSGGIAIRPAKVSAWLRDYPRRPDRSYVANDPCQFSYRNTGNGLVDEGIAPSCCRRQRNRKPVWGPIAPTSTALRRCSGRPLDGARGRHWLPYIFAPFLGGANTLYQKRDGLFRRDGQGIVGIRFIPLGFRQPRFRCRNDGDLDIHVTNGHVIDNVKLYRHSHYVRGPAVRNVVSKFRDVTALAGQLQARASARTRRRDFDNDGNLACSQSRTTRRPFYPGRPGRHWS